MSASNADSERDIGNLLAILSCVNNNHFSPRAAISNKYMTLAKQRKQHGNSPAKLTDSGHDSKA